MAEYNLTHLGQANLSGDLQALFKDQFIPEIITEFKNKRVVKNYVRTKTITKGKSASFPVLGTTTAQYFTPNGVDKLGGQTIARNEVTIYLDPFLAVGLSYSELEAKLQEYDDRAEIKTEIADAMAECEDKNLLRTAVLTARKEGTVVGRPGGAVLKAGTDVMTNAATLAASIYAAGTVMDEKKIPTSDRVCFVRPLQYSLLCQYENIADKNIGGGSYSDGTTGMLNGIKIIKTLNLPMENIEETDDTVKGATNKYYGDFSKTTALVMHKGAIGLLTRQGLITECIWDGKYVVHLITARLLQGMGALRPEAAVEISSEAA